MHKWHVTLERTPHLFSVYSPMWRSLLDYKKGDPGLGERGRAQARAHIFSGSCTTTEYTDKQDVGLLSFGRPEPG
jgi:hypothetical protein